MIEFASNGSTDPGYLAVPDSGTGPGVVVIQEWWGLVDHIKDVCDRFAGEGFVALAPDLYHGAKTVEPDEAAKAKAISLVKDTFGVTRVVVQLAVTSPSVGTTPTETITEPKTTIEPKR